MNKKFIDRICNWLLVLLPVVLFFSYHPVITIGTNETMNLELSLPEIWLVLFSLVNLSRIRSLMKFYRKRKLALASIIPLYFTISIIWSENRLRGLLTAGLTWLVAFSVLNIVYRLKMSKLERKSRFGGLINIALTTLLVSAVVMSIYCWIQCILDVAGVSRDTTLLCRGCVSTAFGFPHPNGFAIEPQFMGNLLIAPVLLCYYLLNTFDKQRLFKKKASLIAVTVFLNTTLFFTFSRGAIYAMLAGFVLELLLLIKPKKDEEGKKIKAQKVNLGSSLGIVVSTFVVSLCAQGVFATVSPTNDDFLSGVAKSIHHLTLGVIDLRPSVVEKSEHFSTKTEQTEQTFPQIEQGSNESDFSGYVAESTNRRLDLNCYAFETWESNPQYKWIGTGIGGAGVAMNKQFPDEVGKKEIVQNEYVSLLLETGLIGCGFVLLFALGLAKRLRIYKPSPLFISLVFSYLLTLMFFSGLPNALQIYLLPALLFFV